MYKTTMVKVAIDKVTVNNKLNNITWDLMNF